MTMHEYVMIRTLGLLTTANFEKTEQSLRDDPNAFEFEKIAAPMTRSLVVSDFDGNLKSIIKWANEVRASSNLKITAVHTPDQDGALPAHMMSAFAGSTTHLLQVTAGTNTTTYWLDWKTSRPSFIAGTDVVSLIDLQKNSEQFWERIAKKVTEFFSWNGRPEVSAKELREMLLKGATYGEDQIVSYAISEGQVAAKLLNQEFNIPESYKKFFSTYDRDAEAIASFNGDPVLLKEYVPSNDQLNFAQTPLVNDFVEFVNLQNSSKVIWARIAEFLQNLEYLDLGEVNVDSVEKIVSQMDENTFANASPAAMLDIIQKQCRGEGTVPVRSDKPSVELICYAAMLDAEQLKEQIAEKDILHIVPNPDPFEIFSWIPILEFPKVQSDDHYEKIFAEYVRTLEHAEKFAKENESPFYEAFKLASHVLKSLDLKGAGFTERADAVFERETSDLGFYRDCGWSEYKIRAILSSSIANVFGGMGSWNDQGFAGEEYDRVSSELHKALREFFTAALNLKVVN